MADMLQFELVSPEQKLASFQAQSVALPSTAGDMTALANHEPTIAGLRPGIVLVVNASGETLEYVVSGGFAEINETSVTVLAERSVARHAADADFFTLSIQELEGKLANQHGDQPLEKMRLEALLADVKQAQSLL